MTRGSLCHWLLIWIWGALFGSAAGVKEICWSIKVGGEHPNKKYEPCFLGCC
jgi:hypothetical protein